MKNYYDENKEIIKSKRKAYYDSNKDKVRKSESKYRKRRRLKDPIFKLRTNVRNHVFQFLRDRKVNKSIQYLGCTAEQLKEYLESKFKPGMTWDNYGKQGWHIDHIFPLSKANLLDEQQKIKLLHYTNLQPLWAHENQIKGNKVS